MQLAHFTELAEGVERALFTFESTSNHAVLRMYRSGQAVELGQSRSSFASLSPENQILLGDESENVFLVYLYVSLCLSCLATIHMSTIASYSRFKNMRASSFP